jgi:hypothetical protein
MDGNTNLSGVSSSRFDIYSKLLTIANNYTNVFDTDFLRTGLFGYITEAMSMVARDGSFHRTMLYNESFLNTAVMPKSVYNWAKMFNVPVSAAVPAFTDMVITINVDDIENPNYSRSYSGVTKYGDDITRLGSRKILILDRDNPLLAGDTNFRLEKSIAIYKSTESGGAYIVKYIETEEKTTEYFKPESFFIKSNVTRTSGIEYLTFKVRAHQYNVTTSRKQITNSSFLNTKVHRFAFLDQFVGAKMKYRKGTIEETIELRYSNIGVEELENVKFAYYNLVDDNTIQINFSSAASDFTPSVNSTLIIDIYTTKGSTGNIVYSGDVIFRMKEESLRSLPISVSMVNYQSNGGSDRPSLTKLKNTIINEISTRDVIVTENDLNNFFVVLTSLIETVNDGKITFIKKRDDILRRIFTSYILLRDGLDINNETGQFGYLSGVIPTNTVSADFQISGNISKAPGTIIQRKSETLEEYEYVPSNALDGSGDYYIIPFYTRIILNPFKKVKYIYNMTNSETGLSYKSITSGSSDRYIIPSTVYIRRGLEGTNASSKYNIVFQFVSNFDFASQVSPVNDEFVLSFFRSNNPLVAIDNLSFYKNQKLSITSTVNSEDETLYDTLMLFTIDVDSENEEFDFANETASTDFGTFINLTHDNRVVKLPEDVKVVLKFNNILSDNLNIEFTSDETLPLFRNLDEIMFSDIIIRVDEDNFITSINVKDIPVIHASFFTDEANYSKLIEQLFAYIELLKQNLGRLESNTFFNLKFFNTYGQSQLYNTLKTNIDLEMDIYVTELTDGLTNNIRDYIRILVDGANNSRSLKVSSIINSLTSNFPIIDHIDFKGLNSTFNQYVDQISSLTLAQRKQYVPEYLNLQKSDLEKIRVIEV